MCKAGVLVLILIYWSSKDFVITQMRKSGLQVDIWIPSFEGMTRKLNFV